jgi:anti-anti-sigma regulatory factor
VEVSADLQITDLTVDDHACLTFGDSEELLDLTAAFVRDGISSGLKILWISESAGQLEPELAARGPDYQSAIASGQVSALDCDGHVLRDQTFSSGPAIDWLAGQVGSCLREGFAGLRVALDMSWALRPVSGVAELPAFEDRIAAVLSDRTATMLCQYDRERFDPVTLARIAPVHTRSVAAATYHADALLRICRQYAPPGVRIAGELDYHAAEALGLALTEALRIDTDITVNLVHLAFIDATCARMILDSARAIGANRQLILRCSPSIARSMTLFGAAELDSVQVVTVHDR